MGEPVKFTFFETFDGGEKSKFDTELEQLRADAANAQQQAFEQGRNQGREDTLRDIEAHTLNTLTAMTGQMQALLEQRSALEEQLKRQSVKLCGSILEKLVPSILGVFPTKEIETLIETCLEHAGDIPKMNISVHPAIKPQIESHIVRTQQSSHLNVELFVLENPNLSQHDVEISWANGGMEFHLGTIEEKIGETIETFISRHHDSGLSATGNGAEIRQLKQG